MCLSRILPLPENSRVVELAVVLLYCLPITITGCNFIFSWWFVEWNKCWNHAMDLTYIWWHHNDIRGKVGCWYQIQYFWQKMIHSSNSHLASSKHYKQIICKLLKILVFVFKLQAFFDPPKSEFLSRMFIKGTLYLMKKLRCLQKLSCLCCLQSVNIW